MTANGLIILKNGIGKLSICNGYSTYEGEFKNGEMTGKGKRIWHDTSSYEGQFELGHSWHRKIHRAKWKYL